MISEHNISPVVTSVNHNEFCQTLSVFVMHISYHVVIESLAKILEYIHKSEIIWLNKKLSTQILQ